jgi:hypothetical protein
LAGDPRVRAAILESYDTGVTRRQWFCRLVADETLKNTLAAYSQLSDQTARARREEGTLL